MKLASILALSLSLATATVAAMPSAEACGGYSVTPTAQVRRAGMALEAENVYMHPRRIFSIEVHGDEATVDLRWDRRGKRETSQLVTFRRDEDGRWVRTGMSYAI